MPRLLAYDPPKFERFGDQIIRYFNILGPDHRTGGAVCPGRRYPAFADRAKAITLLGEIIQQKWIPVLREIAP